MGIDINKLVCRNITITPPPVDDPLCFTAQEDNSSIAMAYGWSGDTTIKASLQISIDGQKSWTEWDGHIVPLNNGEKMFVKALNDNPNGFYDKTNDVGHRFVMRGKIAASGNIQYLLTSDGSRMDVPEKCYDGMFQSCTSLTQAPKLPATTLFNGCYGGMFYNCQSLTQAPELPATILAYNCYYYMFYDCSSLTQAPELPATTLDGYCYGGMFYNCNKFTEVHMKSSMEGVYNKSIHGIFNDSAYSGIDRMTVIYDL